MILILLVLKIIKILKLIILCFFACAGGRRGCCHEERAATKVTCATCRRNSSAHGWPTTWR